jgi:HPt (histidine-containing phosphotransfer) domain-containing protein
VDPLDPTKLRELIELTGGDRTWVRELLNIYVDDTRKRLADLGAVVAAGIPDRIQRDAHGIKGSSGNVGASRMAQLCQQMETYAREGDLAGARRHLVDMQDEFDRIGAWVARFSAS